VSHFNEAGHTVVTGATDDRSNAIVALSQGTPKSVYHKCKLIPSFETLRYQKNPIGDPVPIHNGTGLLGAFLCYETLFPSVSRALTQRGASFLGAISFNTWLGDTNWPLLQMAYLPFRAVENNRYSFYLNNNGPSIVVSPHARILEKIGFKKTGFITFEAPALSQQTFYTKHGDIFVWACMVMGGLMLLKIKNERGG
jgi:apolipoprotein N-acyltransferase